MMKVLLLIGSGSFLGGISRFLLARYVQNNVLSTFPFGTFLVNIIGCFVIGFFYGLNERHLSVISTETRMFFAIGFLGSFTTFSTFSYENIMLLRDGSYALFGLYASLSLIVCLLATLFGSVFSKLF